MDFRSTMRGFSVWCYAENVTEDSPRWRKVGELKKQISWREVCRFLLSSEELHVFGDLFSDVIVAGLASPFDELVKAVFIIDDDAPIHYGKVVQLMIGFSDQELDKLHQDLGGILSPYSASLDGVANSSYGGLNSLAKLANEHQILGKSLAEIKVWACLRPDASIKAVVAALRSRRQLKIITPVVDAQLPQKLIKREATIVNRVADADLKKWQLLVEGSPPAADQLVTLARLFLSKRDHLVSMGMFEWQIIKWLFLPPDGLQFVLESLRNQNPNEVIELVSIIMALGKSSARNFEYPHRWVGGALAGMGVMIKQKEVLIALECQKQADRLNIIFPSKYRISDLPFWGPREDLLSPFNK